MSMDAQSTVVLNDEAQEKFDDTDVDTSKMDVCAQAGVQAVKEGRLLQSDNELLSPDAKGAYEDVISKFWNSDQSVDDAVKAVGVALKR